MGALSDYNSPGDGTDRHSGIKYPAGSDMAIRYASFCEVNHLWALEQRAGSGWLPYFVDREEWEQRCAGDEAA